MKDIFKHNLRYSNVSGVYDFLEHCSVDVRKELIGMALENGFKETQFLDFKIRILPKITGISQKLEMTKGDYNQYYQQTLMNFQQAMAFIPSNLAGKRVLEIGSTYDYYFLKSFKERMAECFALNIHFDLPENFSPDEWPVKVLADMNHLPFLENSFDIVLISATSHHSNTPEKLITEIARILKKGGICLMINDPINGLVKSLGSSMTCQRHDHINENEYSLSRYNRAFKKAGFRPQQLFSHYYDQKLLKAEIHPNTRFAFVAKIVVYLWKVPQIRSILKRYFLGVAQNIFGFPMNVILIKQ